MIGMPSKSPFCRRVMIVSLVRVMGQLRMIGVRLDANNSEIQVNASAEVWRML